MDSPYADYINKSAHEGINTRLNGRLISDQEMTELVNVDINIPGRRVKRLEPGVVADFNPVPVPPVPPIPPSGSGSGGGGGGQIGAVCSVNGDCAPGLVCINGTCQVDPGPPPVPPTGACNLPGGGSCIITNPVDCAAQGGAYQGDGTTCHCVTNATSGILVTLNATNLGADCCGLPAGYHWNFEAVPNPVCLVNDGFGVFGIGSISLAPSAGGETHRIIYTNANCSGPVIQDNLIGIQWIITQVGPNLRLQILGCSLTLFDGTSAGKCLPLTIANTITPACPDNLGKWKIADSATLNTFC